MWLAEGVLRRSPSLQLRTQPGTPAT
jgi:hypothetical protein